MMDDLISRQALIKEFADFVKRSNNSDFASTPTWNDAVSLVGSMPSAEPEPRWIPVTERLPEVGKFVLVTDIYLNDVDIMCKAEDSGWEDRHQNWSSFECVSAWCELPEPYKGGYGDE